MSFLNLENDFDGWAAQVIDEICEEVKRGKTNSEELRSLAKQDENGANSQWNQRNAASGSEAGSRSISSQTDRATAAEQEDEILLKYNFESALDSASEEHRLAVDSDNFSHEDVGCSIEAQHLMPEELLCHSQSQSEDGAKDIASNEYGFQENEDFESLEIFKTHPLARNAECFVDLVNAPFETPATSNVMFSLSSTETDHDFVKSACNDNFGYDTLQNIVSSNLSDKSVQSNKNSNCSLNLICTFENEVIQDEVDQSSSLRADLMPQSMMESQFCLSFPSDKDFSSIPVQSAETISSNETIEPIYEVSDERIDLDAMEKTDAAVSCFGPECVEDLKGVGLQEYRADETAWQQFMEGESMWREEVAKWRHTAPENLEKNLELTTSTTYFDLSKEELDFLREEEFLERLSNVANKSYEVEVPEDETFEEGYLNICDVTIRSEETWTELIATPVDSSHSIPQAQAASSDTNPHPLIEKDTVCSLESESCCEDEILQERAERVVDSYRGVCRAFEDLCVRPIATFLADNADFFLFMLFICIHLLFELVKLFNSETARSLGVRVRTVLDMVRSGVQYLSSAGGHNAGSASPAGDELVLAQAVVCCEIRALSLEGLDLTCEAARSLKAVSACQEIPYYPEHRRAEMRTDVDSAVRIVYGGDLKGNESPEAIPPREAVDRGFEPLLERDFLESKSSLGSSPFLHSAAEELFGVQRSLSQPDLGLCLSQEFSSTDSFLSASLTRDGVGPVSGSTGDGGFGSREFRCGEELHPPCRLSLVEPLDENARAMAHLELPEALGSPAKKSASRVSLGRRVSSIFSGWRKKDLMHCVMPPRHRRK